MRKLFYRLILKTDVWGKIINDVSRIDPTSFSQQVIYSPLFLIYLDKVRVSRVLKWVTSNLLERGKKWYPVNYLQVFRLNAVFLLFKIKEAKA